MAEFKAILTNFLELTQFCALVASLGMLFFVYRLTQRERKQRLSNTQSDLTNMMILFQTMRDMLRQQKDLARQLNESLDKKVGMIRSAVDDALRDIDAVREQARQLSKNLSAASEELSSIQRQVAYVREDSPAAAPLGPEFVEPPLEPERAPRVAPPPALHILAPPTTPRHSDGDLIENWVGLDFGAVADDLTPEVVAPEQPSDAEAARQAFRALLNLDDAAPAAPSTDDDESGEPFAPVPLTASGNGNGKAPTSPIQGRVYEYSDAGMTIAQISRELGIGKGEVRLILGLRSDKER